MSDPSHGRLRVRHAHTDDLPCRALEPPVLRAFGVREIPRQTVRPELVAAVSEEPDRGLDPDTRVVMGYRCGLQANRE